MGLFQVGGENSWLSCRESEIFIGAADCAQNSSVLRSFLVETQQRLARLADRAQAGKGNCFFIFEIIESLFRQHWPARSKCGKSIATLERDFQCQEVLAKTRCGSGQIGVNGTCRREIVGELSLPGGPVAPEFADVGDRLTGCGDVLEE